MYDCTVFLTPRRLSMCSTEVRTIIRVQEHLFKHVMNGVTQKIFNSSKTAKTAMNIKSVSRDLNWVFIQINHN